LIRPSDDKSGRISVGQQVLNATPVFSESRVVPLRDRDHLVDRQNYCDIRCVPGLNPNWFPRCVTVKKPKARIIVRFADR